MKGIYNLQLPILPGIWASSHQTVYHVHKLHSVICSRNAPHGNSVGLLYVYICVLYSVKGPYNVATLAVTQFRALTDNRPTCKVILSRFNFGHRHIAISGNNHRSSKCKHRLAIKGNKFCI